MGKNVPMSPCGGANANKTLFVWEPEGRVQDETRYCESRVNGGSGIIRTQKTYTLGCSDQVQQHIEQMLVCAIHLGNIRPCMGFDRTYHRSRLFGPHLKLGETDDRITGWGKGHFGWPGMSATRKVKIIIIEGEKALTILNDSHSKPRLKASSLYGNYHQGETTCLSKQDR